MIYVRKPPRYFSADLLLRHLEGNYHIFSYTSSSPIRIYDVDYELNEELTVSCTMLDRTEVTFSMISNELYIRKNGEYELFDEETEIQKFCFFNLYLRDDMMYFVGRIYYENIPPVNYRYKEDFIAIIIVKRNERLLDIWNKHDKIIM